MKNKLPLILRIAVILLWGMACFAFFQFQFQYHLFYQEQSQLFLMTGEYVRDYYHGTGWLSRLLGDFLTQFYYYRYAGPAILTLCLLTLGSSTYRLLRRPSGSKQAANSHMIWNIVALIAALLVMTLEAVFCLHNTYRLSDVLSHSAIVGALVIAKHLVTVGGKAIFTAHRSIIGKLVRSACAVATLAIAYWLFGFSTPKMPTSMEWALENDMAVSCEYGFGNWNRVVRMVETTPSPDATQLYFYNLVKAQRGMLPDVLLRYQPNNLGTFQSIGPKTPLMTIWNMNELYWALGDMMFTERAALMTSVFSRENRNVRMVKRLAECNMVSGDTVAAEKYLRLLDKTLVYSKWAQQCRTNGATIYKEKRQTTNTTDTLRLGDNCHTIMCELLQSNPQNTTALDYLLCSDLLLKDIETFKQDYDRFCPTPTTHHPIYQQALCIWLAGTQASEEEWKRYIHNPGVLQRFQQYNLQRGSAAFSDTYWYYFDTAKPIQ